MSGRHLNALVCHPASAASGIIALAVAADYSANGLALNFRLTGDPHDFIIPPPSPATATDGLWQHTCCEAFIASDSGTDYREFNFSPSGQWAAYRFTDYRGRDERFQAPLAPLSTFRLLPDGFQLDATIARALLPTAAMLHVGLSAVIEGSDGSRSYWALSHGGPAPDFHLRSSFTLQLETP
ncbi:DOMON-like domain-containing protein [Dechloromonas sp. A34]|uniref:DOMON-like domain-containing protein n=1 Tax=Dechloromonas sp. A34 TaxID=447588 RepID=UPI002249035D|nr:DOMON-like domain-containing protein [Dechloromonas sp. A34]